MDKSRTLLVVEHSRDATCPTIERALRGIMQRADLHCVSDCVELKDYLERKGRWEASPGPLPCLIYIDFESIDDAAFAALRAVKEHPDMRRIPVIALFSPKKNGRLRDCYEIGVNSVVERPEDEAEFERRLKIICNYWFEHVELPTAR